MIYSRKYWACKHLPMDSRVNQRNNIWKYGLAAPLSLRSIGEYFEFLPCLFLKMILPCPGLIWDVISGNARRHSYPLISLLSDKNKLSFLTLCWFLLIIWWCNIPHPQTLVCRDVIFLKWRQYSLEECISTSWGEKSF